MKKVIVMSSIISFLFYFLVLNVQASCLCKGQTCICFGVQLNADCSRPAFSCIDSNSCYVSSKPAYSNGGFDANAGFSGHPYDDYLYTEPAYSNGGFDANAGFSGHPYDDGHSRYHQQIMENSGHKYVIFSNK